MQRGTALLRHDEHEAVLIVPTGDLLVLETGDGSGLEERLARLQSLARAPLSVVVVGGERPRHSPGIFGKVTLFWIAPNGSLRGGGWIGRPARVIAPMLRVAIRRLDREGFGLTEDERNSLLLAGEALRSTEPTGEETLFWSKLAAQTPWATYTLTGLIGLVFLLESLWGGSDFAPTLYRMGANVPGKVRDGEVYRLFAAAFLHIGIVHLVANLWALRVFGIFLEKVLGSAAFLALYALSALSGSLMSVGLGKASLSAGASGALWGLMVGGFALSFFGPVPEGLRARIRATGWQPIFLNLAISFSPGIDLFAHLGGGLAGGLLVLVGTALRIPGGTLVAIPSFLLSSLMPVCVLWAIVAGRPWELTQPPQSWRRFDLPQAGLSLEAPETLGAPRLRGNRYLIGAFPKDPVQVVVSWTDSSGAVEDPSRRAEALAASLEEGSPEGTPQGPAVPTLLEGRPAAHRKYVFRTGGTLVVWLAQEEKVLTRVQIIVLPQADPRWGELGDRLARSLKEHPSP